MQSCIRFALFVAFCQLPASAEVPFHFIDGERTTKILVSENAPEAERFAASELSRYLSLMTGRQFEVTNRGVRSQAEPEILIGRGLAESAQNNFSEQQFGTEGYLLRRDGSRLIVAGVRPRATLYAAYALLEKLGCRWFAPDFSFYSPATGESVPKVADPMIDTLNEISKPSFPVRALFMEEGESHTPESLVQIVTWMAKVHMNALNVPIDYEHRGHTMWDNYRDALIPELRKRDLLLEVGGHGYPNFLPQEKYFAQHPEWFGMVDGKRSPAPDLVFSTANPDAMRTFIQNVQAYLEHHPEINIFDCLPPDSTRWSEAPEDVALGTPSDRQMLLLNQLAGALKPEFPNLIIQFNAYSNFVEPPEHVHPSSSLLMSFSPYARSFETSLFDPAVPENSTYAKDLSQWIHGWIAPDHVTLYSYITKYQWRSLPILIPHLIAADIKQIYSMGLGGLETYSEPGCWGTFEVDHYITARLLWNAALNVDDEMTDYTTTRFGSAARPVAQYLHVVEEVVPHSVGIPGTTIQFKRQPESIKRMQSAADLLQLAQQDAASDPATLALIERLDISRRYALNEMQLRLTFHVAGDGWKRDQIKSIEALLAERRKIIEEGRNHGLILVDQRLD